jgi:hypothetical protein
MSLIDSGASSVVFGACNVQRVGLSLGFSPRLAGSTAQQMPRNWLNVPSKGSFLYCSFLAFQLALFWYFVVVVNGRYGMGSKILNGLIRFVKTKAETGQTRE